MYKNNINFEVLVVNYEKCFVKKEISDYSVSSEVSRPMSAVLDDKRFHYKSCADFIKRQELKQFTYYYKLEEAYANGFTIENIIKWINFIKPFIDCDIEVKDIIKNPDPLNTFSTSMHLPLELKNCKNSSNFSNYIRVILLRYILYPRNGSIVKLSIEIYESLKDEFNITEWVALLMAHYYRRKYIDDSLGNNPKMNLTFENLATVGEKSGLNYYFQNKEDFTIPIELFINKNYKSIYLTLKQKYDTL